MAYFENNRKNKNNNHIIYEFYITVEMFLKKLYILVGDFMVHINDFLVYLYWIFCVRYLCHILDI